MKTNFDITARIELFEPRIRKYDEVTLVDAYDSFTHNIAQAFLKLGAPVRVFRSKEVELDELNDYIGNYLVLSPGPGKPEDAGIHKDAIQTFKDKIPILGICLGMQAINEVYGGITKNAIAPVHGKISMVSHTETGIFSKIPTPTQVARYHSLVIGNLAPSFKIQSTYKEEIMAFHKPNSIAAVQFHPESFLTTHGPKMLLNFLEGVF
ncbi:MAG: anthranilate synthase component II [Candidatus Kariarchaeaceae archaeon]